MSGPDRSVFDLVLFKIALDYKATHFKCVTEDFVCKTTETHPMFDQKDPRTFKFLHRKKSRSGKAKADFPIFQNTVLQ